MILDCRGLECPQPVINTKKALEDIGLGEWLHIKINSKIVLENVLKFIEYSGHKATLQTDGSEWVVSVQKATNAPQTSNTKQELEEKKESSFSSDNISLDIPPHEQEGLIIDELSHHAKKKIIYLNDDKAGSGEVGATLLAKLLSSFVLLSEHVYAVVCLNTGVYLTTNRANQSMPALRDLEQKGVRVISCGACLSAYGLVDKVAVGEIGNAYEIAELLTKYEQIKL